MFISTKRSLFPRTEWLLNLADLGHLADGALQFSCQDRKTSVSSIQPTRKACLARSMVTLVHLSLHRPKDKYSVFNYSYSVLRNRNFILGNGRTENSTGQNSPSGQGRQCARICLRIDGQNNFSVPLMNCRNWTNRLVLCHQISADPRSLWLKRAGPALESIQDLQSLASRFCQLDRQSGLDDRHISFHSLRGSATFPVHW